MWKLGSQLGPGGQTHRGLERGGDYCRQAACLDDGPRGGHSAEGLDLDDDHLGSTEFSHAHRILGLPDRLVGGEHDRQTARIKVLTQSRQLLDSGDRLFEVLEAEARELSAGTQGIGAGIASIRIEAQRRVGKQPAEFLQPLAIRSQGVDPVLGDLRLDGADPAIAGEDRLDFAGGTGRQSRIDGDGPHRCVWRGRAQQGRTGAETRELEGRPQPPRGLGRAVFEERRELRPSGRAFEHDDLPLGDPAETRDHRQPQHMHPVDEVTHRVGTCGTVHPALTGNHAASLSPGPQRPGPDADASSDADADAGPPHRRTGDRLGTMTVSDIFDPSQWREVSGFDFTDITYHRAINPDGSDLGCVRIAFDRPEVRNAFRPHTVDELYRALDHARQTSDVGAVLLTGNGPSPKDGGWAFCSGGDQRIRGRSGYQYAEGETRETVDPARAGRLHILEVQRLIRTMPKIVIAVVPGWAAGGGHSLHVVCDMTIASTQHAKFKQTDADVGSYDAGYGSAYLAKLVGQKKAREIFFLGRTYSAQDMAEMGAVNEVVDHAELETAALTMAREILGKSPNAQRMLKFAFNLVDDGLMGQQVFAGEATRLGYMTDEAVEGRDAFLEKRDPDWAPYPWYY